MIESHYIGSSDITALLSNKHSKGHQKLLRRFVSGNTVYHNALNSPIEACRIGAILEYNYGLYLSDCSYYYQYHVQSKEMDVFKATLDWAKLDNGQVIDFDEVKTISMDDFMFVRNMSYDQLIKKYKAYYNQIQEQLYCTGLNSCNLVFICVYSYDDSENMARTLTDKDIFKVRIMANKHVINDIKEAGSIFYQIKNYYK